MTRLPPVAVLFALTAPASVAHRAPERALRTYVKDIAPIVQQHCASCHRPGQAAPFSLLSYTDVRERAQLIRTAVVSRFMPPWKPEPEPHEFVGQRRLSSDEISALDEWVAQGSPEGDSAQMLPVADPPEGWRLGEPDLVITLDEPYALGADGPDELRNFVVSIATERHRFVRGIEFRPANPKVVHHATMRIDQTRSSRRLDDEDAKPGYAGILAPDARYPDGHFLAWTPGQLRPLAEDGLAWRLEPDSDLVLQLHLQPSGRPEVVDAAIGFYFTDRPPDRQPSILRLSRQNLDIRPGERGHVVEDRYRLPVDVELREIQPHAHLVARRFESFVELPDGSTRPLIRIADWDFKWQDVYRLKTPMRLPAGSFLVMRVTFDNSPHNLRNPFVPPRRIFWGQNTVDEMADLWVQVLTGSSADRSLLERDMARKIALEDVVGYEGALAREPRNAALHESVAAYYLQLGQGPRAISHLERAVQLNPRSAMSRYNLGTALLVLGRRGEAMTRFSEAIELQPDLAYAHNSLGFALRGQGRTEEAIEHYRRALTVEPRYAHAYNNLGVALQALGRVDEAARSYAEAVRLKPSDPVPRRNWAKVLAVQGHGGEAIAQLRAAVESSPDWPELVGDLAWILAVHADPAVRSPQEALALASRAAEATGNRDARILDVLAAAWAATAQYDRAADAAGAGMTLARQHGDRALADSIRARALVYADRRAYSHDFASGYGR
jgi:Flp pilus assembly protein TadD/mono/diheme cytochrome c family protein